MKRTALLTSLFLVFVSLSAVATPKADPVAEVTRFENHMEKFFNSDEYKKNPSLAIPYFDASDDLHMFDIMEPGEFSGDAFRKHFVEVGGAMTGTLKYLNLKVYASDTLAFAHYTQHYVGQDKEGNKVELMAPTTDCLRKTNGKWHIVHMHESVVVDIPTFVKLMKPKQ